MIRIKFSHLFEKYLFRLSFFILLIVYSSIDIYGQSLNNNSTSLNTSQFQNSSRLMPYDQLQLFWADAQRRGYDINTVPSLFQENGYSLSESLQMTQQIRFIEQSKYGNSFLGFGPSLSEEEQGIFGLSIFRNRNFSFDNTNNLPTPENYTLGAGDQINILIYGETDASYDLVINKEGDVSIPFIGPISLQGLTIKSAKSFLKQKLSAVHSGLSGSNPNVFLDLSLTNLRSISISIVGETERPGSYKVPSNSSLIEVLYRSQGPTINGTLRNIKIFRSNKLLHEVDIYDFLTKGITPNISFKDQDIVLIETYKKRVKLTGGIRNPAIYELKGESISELIELAGGLKPGTDKGKVILSRLNGANQFVGSIDLSFSSENLEDGDVIDFPLIDDYNIEKIKITGAINRPGYYNYASNKNLEELLDSAGGFREDALVSRIAIFQNSDKINPSLKVLNALKEDLSKISIGEIGTIFIPSILELSEPDYITIEGSINRNGEIPFFKGMTILDAIIFANGIADTAIGGKIEIVRNKSFIKNEGYDFFVIDIPLIVEELEEFNLQPRDKIFVRDNWLSSNDKSVTVIGEVGQPGNFIINPGVTRVADIIERTGKFPSTANLNGVKLYRVVQVVNDIKDNKIERTTSIADFINNPRFEGSVSTLQGRNILESLEYLENNSEEKKDTIPTIQQGNRIDKLNGFELSKEYLVNRENNEFLEIGLSFDEILVNKRSQYNVTLLDGDILFIPPRANLVEIDGNVFSPTQAIFRKEKSFRDYIETAGGFMRKSDIRRSYIEYSNGEIKRVKSFLLFRKYPEVKTDSRIVVPVKPPGSTLNFDRIVSVISSTISTYLLIQAVSTSTGN